DRDSQFGIPWSGKVFLFFITSWLGLISYATFVMNFRRNRSTTTTTTTTTVATTKVVDGKPKQIITTTSNDLDQVALMSSGSESIL
ncbi:MAG: hypothetical protein N6V41_00755, partial [Candidatus Portiera aleyrodidarum]|nr:hypothetical protein [Candidatus Portiera aleyrodidarum]